MANLKLLAVRSFVATALFAAGGLTLAALLRISTAHALRRRTPTLDVPNRGPETPNLSEVLNWP